MRKVFNLFLLIVLGLVLTSCKEDIKYERYGQGDFLNEEIIKVYDEKNRMGLIKPPVSLENIDEKLKNGSLYKVHIEEEINDYYLCGYLDNNIRKKINNKDNDSSAFYGREKYVSLWVEAINENIISKEENPIYWYIVPKTENVEMEIKDKFLVLVFESIDAIYESVDNNEIKRTSILFENKSFYKNESSENWDNNSSILKGDKLQIVTESFNENLINGIILAYDYIYCYPIYSFEMEYYDNIPFVNVENGTIYHDEDLKNKFEYKEKEETQDISYLFKLEDILSVIKK